MREGCNHAAFLAFGELSMSKILLIDGNNIGYASQMSNRLTVGDVETQAVYGVLKTIRKIIKKFPYYTLVILFDGKAQWRMDIWPEYKGNRDANKAMKDMRESYMAQLPLILDGLSHLGIAALKNDNAEADDIAGLFAKRANKKGDELLLVSRDKDWLQLVSPFVSVYNPIDDVFTNVHNFTERTGYIDGETFLQAKAMMGDSSDNIPPVGGFGKSKLPEWMMRWGSIDGFMEQAREMTDKELTAAERGFLKNEAPKSKTLKSGEVREYAPRQDAFQRNYTIMNLLQPAISANEIKVINKPYGDLDRFANFCSHLAFHSILREMDGWASDFGLHRRQAA